LLVHRDQYDEVFGLILDRARGLRIGGALSADDVGTGVDVGSMISQERFQFLQDTVEAAERQGAHVELGGRRRDHPYLTNGAFFEPTVIGEVQRDMDIAQKECEYCLRIRPELRVDAVLCIVFAPIALVMPYDNIEDAIEIANESRYALGASVFGPEKYECLDVAKKLHCGMVSINDFGVFYVCSYTCRIARVFLLTRSSVEVRQTTVDMHCIVFTPNFLLIAKISPSEAQRPVATEDSVSVLSLAFM
jgi:Aldehyde dehydrogenase family